MAKPSIKQRRLMKGWRLRVPSTIVACSTIISYVLHGPKDDQRSVVQRMRQVRTWQHRFKGARISITQRGHPDKGKQGNVVRLQVRALAEQAAILEHCHNNHPYPYVAMVELDEANGKIIRVPLSGLRILNPGNQPTLFPLGGETTKAEPL